MSNEVLIFQSKLTAARTNAGSFLPRPLPSQMEPSPPACQQLRGMLHTVPLGAGESWTTPHLMGLCLAEPQAVVLGAEETTSWLRFSLNVLINALWARDRS